ncbi:MAG: phosphoglucosamine mutase [Longimicrobiales bacterium]|nr:phosphoglucosamine mutase [Longimicrobiales bacterium]
MPLRLPDDLMVSVSGVRGRVGASMTPELIVGIAAAFGTWLREGGHEGPLVMGRDSRTSGPMLGRSVLAGLQSVGVDVIDLGVVPTPTALLAVEHHDAAGAIVVTASHNPAEWNALKLVSSEGSFLDAEASREFRDFLATEELARAGWDELGEVTSDPGAVDRHLGAILELPQLDLERLGRRKLKVALDCVRGAGGVIMPRLLEDLGCEVVSIHTEPDGHFPRDPEPTAAHLTELGDLVRECGADIGLAVDPDVDRLSLVDETGTPIGEDLTLALAVAVVLRETPGPVVTNLSTSRVIEDVTDAYDSVLVRAPVGEIHVARRMQEEGAVIGGEGNGGVILPDLHFTRDAPVAAALVLQYLCDAGTRTSRTVADWPRYSIVKRKVAFEREHLEGAYAALIEDLDADEEDRTDGLRLAWSKDRAWLHVRPSGTEPVVRIIAEAPDEDAAGALVRRAEDLLNGVA